MKNINNFNKMMNIVDQLFDKFYGNKYNPLYRTGSIAITLLFIIIITGFSLFLFYDISNPYYSVKIIQNKIIFGKIIRSIHKYATDFILLIVLIHIFRILIKFKFFAARSLSWISGFPLLFLLFLASLTGYILIWDEHALLIASSGAKLLDHIPIFNEPLSRIFSGERKLDNSFFFINLFIHISLPLMMILILWIHTVKLHKPNWITNKKITINIILALIIISFCYPIKLIPKANLLQIPKNISLDWFYGFWIPILNSLNIYIFLLISITLTVASISLPYLLRKKYSKKQSTSDKNFCKACMKCVDDCPYQAISMIKINDGKKNKTIAEINNNLCVSCGICSASCDLMHLGPENQKGIDQIKTMKKFINKYNINKNSVIIMYCSNKELSDKKFKSLFNNNDMNFFAYKHDCLGSLHIKALKTLRSSSGGILIITCSKISCKNSNGVQLFKNRIIESEKINSSQNLIKNIHFFESSIINTELIQKHKNAFISHLKDKNIHQKKILFKNSQLKNKIKGLSITLLILFIIAYTQNITYLNNKNSVLRLSWRLSGQKIEICNKISKSELKKIPKHMRNPMGSCTSKAVKYNLLLEIDNKKIIVKNYKCKGLREDNAIFVLINVPIKSGLKDISLKFKPDLTTIMEDEKYTKNLINLDFHDILNFKDGEINLISLDNVSKKLIHIKKNI